MIRDTFFSLHRFVNVCRKEMVENWKTYILRSVMVYGMLAIVFVWNGYYQYHNLEGGSCGHGPYLGSLSPDSFFGDLSFGDALAPRLPWKG